MALTEEQKIARSLGRIGGPKGRASRADALGPDHRSAISRKAVAAKLSRAAASLPYAGQTPPIGRGFFETKTIDRLIEEQGVHPVADIGIFAGAIPDENIDEFVAEIYRDR